MNIAKGYKGILIQFNERLTNGNFIRLEKYLEKEIHNTLYKNVLNLKVRIHIEANINDKNIIELLLNKLHVKYCNKFPNSNVFRIRIL